MIIVGGGVFGCLIALYLRKYLPKLVFSIVDPHDHLMSHWMHRTSICGMTHLRSPVSHSISPDFSAMLTYAKRNGYPKSTFQQPYWRPSLSLFNTFSQHLIETHALEKAHIQEAVVEIKKEKHEWVLRTNTGELKSPRIILALGRPIKPPAFGISAFDPQFSPSSYTRSKELFLFGAGMTGVQLATSLVKMGNKVNLISRHPLYLRQFDSNPCYIGPKCGRTFHQTLNIQERQTIITTARYPGSITPDVHAELNAIKEKYPEKLAIHTGKESTRYYLDLAQNMPSKRVIFATGFGRFSAKDSLLVSIGENTNSTIAPNGTPIPNSSSEWVDGLFLTGSLAELSIGPAAQNIIGAHIAARKIISALM